MMKTLWFPGDDKGFFDKHLAGFPKSKHISTAPIKGNISHPSTLDKYSAQVNLQ